MSGMQKKNINKIITQKIDSWVKSIDCVTSLKHILNTDTPVTDQISQFQNTVKDNILVSGGCIASMLLGEEINDVDLYFTNEKVAKQVAQYYVNKLLLSGNLTSTDKVSESKIINNNTGGVAIFIKSMGVVTDQTKTENYEYFETSLENSVDEFFKEYNNKNQNSTKSSHDVKFLSSNAITLHSDIQIILRFVGNAEQIHKNFDFVHATNYWTSDTGVVFNEKALQSLLERRLYYVGSLFPVASIFRLRKFIQRGYKISAGEMFKIAYDVSKLNLDDPFVLKEQLLGCDVAYFTEVLSIVTKGSSKDIDRTYLFTVINDIFNEGNGNDYES